MKQFWVIPFRPRANRIGPLWDIIGTCLWALDRLVVCTAEARRGLQYDRERGASLNQFSLKHSGLRVSRRSFLGRIAAAVATPAAAPVVTRAASQAGITSARSAEKERKTRLIVLDVGGTIIQDQGDVVRTLIGAMREHGITVSAEEIAPWRGAAKHAVIEHFVAQKGQHSRTAVGSGEDQSAQAKAIYRDFVRQVSKAYMDVPPIAGCEEALKRLRAGGMLLATNTGFEREIVTPILARLGWEKYFKAIVASDDVTEGRPAPYMIFRAMEAAGVKSVGNVMVVGDTVLDLEAAQNAGVGNAIAVLSGVGTEDQFRLAPHAAILKSVVELPHYLGMGE